MRFKKPPGQEPNPALTHQSPCRRRGPRTGFAAGVGLSFLPVEWSPPVVQSVTQRFAASPPAGQDTVILFFNNISGEADDFSVPDLPPGFTLTTDRSRFREAAAVVFHIPNMKWPGLEKPPGQLWVAWSLESEAHYPQLLDPRFMSRFDLTMTYHEHADVVSSYFVYYGTTDNLKRALLDPPKPKSRGKLVNLFVSSPYDKSGRRAYASELMKYLDIHSYGKFLNNRCIEEDQWRPTKLKIIADYKFTLAFENAATPDYVTEKFFDPLVAGSVPVYLGAPNVEHFAPGDHCFINTADFEGPKALSDYLLALDKNEAAYQAYFAWKEKPLRRGFLKMLENQKAGPLVRLCQRVAASREMA